MANQNLVAEAFVYGHKVIAKSGAMQYFPTEWDSKEAQGQMPDGAFVKSYAKTIARKNYDGTVSVFTGGTTVTTARHRNAIVRMLEDAGYSIVSQNEFWTEYQY